MTDWTDRTAPSADEIEAIARQVIATLPAAFAPHAKDVILRVEDFADDAMLDELEIDDPLELTGIYDGVPMTEKSVLRCRASVYPVTQPAPAPIRMFDSLLMEMLLSKPRWIKELGKGLLEL